MTHEDATKWLHRFYRAMKQPQVRARIKRDMKYGEYDDLDSCKNPDKTFTGLHDPFDNVCRISLNPNKRRAGGIVRAVIHELLHEVENDKPHTWINPMELAIYEALSDRQLTNLMKKVFR